MRDQQNITVIHDGSGRIKAVVGRGDNVSRIDLPFSFRSMSDDDLEAAIADLPSNYYVMIDSSGLSLVRKVGGKS